MAGCSEAHEVEVRSRLCRFRRVDDGGPVLLLERERHIRRLVQQHKAAMAENRPRRVADSDPSRAVTSPGRETDGGEDHGFGVAAVGRAGQVRLAAQHFADPAARGGKLSQVTREDQKETRKQQICSLQTTLFG